MALSWSRWCLGETKINFWFLCVRKGLRWALCHWLLENITHYVTQRLQKLIYHYVITTLNVTWMKALGAIKDSKTALEKKEWTQNCLTWTHIQNTIGCIAIRYSQHSTKWHLKLLFTDRNSHLLDIETTHIMIYSLDLVIWSSINISDSQCNDPSSEI